MRIIDLILEFLLPPACIGCSAQGKFICEKCEEKYIEFNQKQLCHVCKKVIEEELVHENCKSLTNLSGVIVTAKYSKFIETIIASIKYKFFTSVVDSVVTIFLKSTLLSLLPENYVITFVPLSRYKMWSRGFNQAELFATGISKIQGHKSHNLIKRVRNTQTQVGKTKHEREENLKEAFRAVNNNLKYDNVVIIDDVMTTGTTLEECAKSLKSSGVKNVYAWVLARG